MGSYKTTNNDKIKQRYCLYICYKLCDIMSTIVQLIKCYRTKIIIHHISMLLLTHPEQFIFFQEIFDKNNQAIHLYIFVNIRKNTSI